MKVTIEIQEINYGDVAVKMMPLMARTAQNQNSAIEKTMVAVSQLPDRLFYDIFDLIPLEQKNDIVAAFAMEYKDKILSVANKKSKEHGIGVTLSDYSISRNLEISAVVDEIDYKAITERFLSEIRERLLQMGGVVSLLKPMIRNATAEGIYGLLEKCFGNNKEAAIASLINQHQEKLIEKIEEISETQNVHLKIRSIFIEV